MMTTKKRLTDEEIIQEVLQSSQDDYDLDISEIDNTEPEATTVNEDGEKDFDREYSSMQEDHQPQDGGVEVTGAGVKHNNLNEVNHNISEDGCGNFLDISPNIPIDDLPMIILSEEITDPAELSKIINSLETGAILEQCIEAEKPKTQQLALVDHSHPDSDFVDIDNLFDDSHHPPSEKETDKENNSYPTNKSITFKRSFASKVNVLQSNKSFVTNHPTTSKVPHIPDSLSKSNPLDRLEKYQGPPDDLEDPDYVPDDDLGDLACLSDSSMHSDEQPPRDPSPTINVTNTRNIQDILEREAHQNEEETIVGENLKRKKNNSDEWKKALSKKQRMAGKEYLGFRRTRDGKVFHDTERSARKMGVRCSSKVCQKSKVRFCNEISNDDRKIIFENFWSNIDWEQRKMFFANTVEKEPVKRRTVEVNEESKSRRGDTLKYHLVVGGKKLQVCQQMYLNTLGIKKWTVRYWVSGDKYNGNTPLDDSISLGMAPNSSVTKVPRAKIPKKKDAAECLVKFFNELPKMPSHYCRKNSSKLYIEPIFESITHLYSVYSEHCNTLEEKEGVPKGSYVLSRCTFDKTYNSINLSIFQLKKDKCDTCASYEVGNVSEESYTNHIALKEKARSEKSADKEKAKKNEMHVYTSDVEAVKVASFLKASALYYKTKLVVHNFTMYNIGTKEVDCFWFDETAGDLEASVFASCVVKQLDEVLTRDPKPVVLWSDGCGNQNRNCIFANALLNLAVEKNVQIEQKFLLKGHTQMECDSVHSNIEEKLKNKEIYLPSQYHSITKEARLKPFPYRSHYLTHSFFRNYSKPETMAYSSIRPGRVAGDATVHDLKAILYKPDGRIETKVDFTEIYHELPRRPKKGVVVGSRNFPPLYSEKRKIPLSKWKHLQELKFVLPEDTHQFYDTLPKE